MIENFNENTSRFYHLHDLLLASYNQLLASSNREEGIRLSGQDFGLGEAVDRSFNISVHPNARIPDDVDVLAILFDEAAYNSASKACHMAILFNPEFLDPNSHLGKNNGYRAMITYALCLFVRYYEIFLDSGEDYTTFKLIVSRAYDKTYMADHAETTSDAHPISLAQSKDSYSYFAGLDSNHYIRAGIFKNEPSRTDYQQLYKALYARETSP